MPDAEADRRGFFTAKKKAFLADGLPYNWSIQQRHFPKFEPIVDFVHVVEYLYTTAKAIHSDVESRWQQYLKWAVACWQGRVSEVIDEITQYQSRFGSVPPGEKLPDSDPRQAIHSTT